MRMVGWARLAAVLMVGLVAGCVKPSPPKDYAAFRAANVRSVLVVPSINRSVYVNAPDYYLTTVTRPLAERGFYVFPVHLVKRLLEDDGLADANFVHDGDPMRLGALFGADSILYVTIERWDSQYVVLSTTTTVELSYVLKDARTGQTLWSTEDKVVYSPQPAGGGVAALIVMAVAAAIEKADPNYMPLARQANAQSVGRLHQGLPYGPYAPEKYGKDREDF